MSDPGASPQPLTRLEPTREARLRDIRLDMAISVPSEKLFDLAEMELLYEDLRQMLGEIAFLRAELEATKGFSETYYFSFKAIEKEYYALESRDAIARTKLELEQVAESEIWARKLDESNAESDELSRQLKNMEAVAAERDEQLAAALADCRTLAKLASMWMNPNLQKGFSDINDLAHAKNRRDFYLAKP